MPRSAPHFKVILSMQRHGKMAGVYEDDALLAMWLRVGMMAVESYADRTGDSFLCSGLDLERLAGCRGVANARRKLGRLEASTRLTIGQEGARWRLTLPNFAKKQGFKTVNGAETGDTTTTTVTVPPSTPVQGVSRVKKTPDPAPEKTLPEEAFKLVTLLTAAVETSVPGSKVPRTDPERRKWADVIEKLERIDGWSWDMITSVIRWIPTHQGSGDFRWGANIRSAKKLREHFARLKSDMDFEAANRGTNGTYRQRSEAETASAADEMRRGFTYGED